MTLLIIFIGILLSTVTNILSDYLIKQRGLALHPRHRLRVATVYTLITFLTFVIWYIPDFHIYMPTIFGLIVLVYFSIVIIIDIEYKLIFNSVSITGGVISLIIGIILRGFKITILGGLAGFCIVYGFYILGWVFTLVMSKIQGKPIPEVAFGFGDVTLSTVLGFLLGWPSILTALFLAILSGGLVSAILILSMLITGKYQRYMAIPFGPFFILGASLIIYVPTFTHDLLTGRLF